MDDAIYVGLSLAYPDQSNIRLLSVLPSEVFMSPLKRMGCPDHDTLRSRVDKVTGLVKTDVKIGARSG